MALSSSDEEIWRAAMQNVQRITQTSTEHLKSATRKPLKLQSKLRVIAARATLQATLQLDLHGKTIMEAYDSTNEFISKSFSNDIRVITIITGASGQIKIEMPKWLELNSKVQNYELTNGNGAYTIRLKKKT